jgi:hypothetical protein
VKTLCNRITSFSINNQILGGGFERIKLALPTLERKRGLLMVVG